MAGGEGPSMKQRGRRAQRLGRNQVVAIFQEQTATTQGTARAKGERLRVRGSSKSRGECEEGGR